MKIENNFYNIFAQLKHAKRPFVLYRLPNTNTLIYIQQKDSSNYTTVSLKEEGFVFAPFNRTNQFIYIPKHHVSKVDIPKPKARPKILNITDTTAQKLYYTNLVANAIKAISNGVIQKVVVSRLRKQKLKQNIAESLVRLLNAYPTAMVYYLSHPKTGTWKGDTTEKQLHLDDGNINTR